MPVTPYVPILAVERGPLDGLAATSDCTRASLTPLFDAHVPTADRISQTIDALERAWERGRPAMIDLGDGRRDQRTADGRVHLASLLDEARARGLALIPVTGLRRSAGYQLAVADAANADGRGAVLRLGLADFHDLDALELNAATLPGTLSLPSEAMDVVVDFGHVADGQLDLLTVMARAVLAALGRAGIWRSIAVAASALPTDETANGTFARRLRERPMTATAPAPSIARTEWLLWRALARTSSRGPALRFADYGAQWPATGPVDGLGGRMPGGQRRIYYTSDAEWLVLDAGAATLDDLVTRPVFRGAAHCAGDAFLARHLRAPHAGTTSGQNADPGGEAAWRAAATVHHLTVVVEQLTAAGASGAAA